MRRVLRFVTVVKRPTAIILLLLIAVLLDKRTRYVTAGHSFTVTDWFWSCVLLLWAGWY